MRQALSLEQRLWAKVERGEPNACWPWRGATYGRGYGLIGKVGGKDGPSIPAHRAAWMLTHGEIPDGMQVCHRCDNPPCCNPEHLFLGTHGDNMRDKVLKGRQHRPSGSTHGNSKLTESKVLEIRARYEAGGVSQYALAADYGVGVMQINRIVNRKHWTHV
jgi:hypothetical protein